MVCELNTFGLSVSRLQHPVPSGIPAHRKIGRAPGSSQAGGRETGSELESGIDGCCWPAVEATAADAVRTAVVTRNYVSTLGGNFQTAGMKFHQTLKNEPWGRGISSSKTLTVISYCSRDRPTKKPSCVIVYSTITADYPPPCWVRSGSFSTECGRAARLTISAASSKAGRSF